MARSALLKTRAGCVKCKQRRVKCSEEKPQCRNCERLGYQGPCRFDANFKAPKGRVNPPTVPSTSAADDVTTIDWGSSEHNHYTQLDMELMHHFTKYTSLTCARPGTLEVWQTVIPGLAYDHPCLMHAIIAVSALHISATTPARAADLFSKAMKSMSVGLPYFRAHLAELGPEHIHRGMAYALLVGFYAFAAPAVQHQGSVFEHPIQLYLEASSLLVGTVYVIHNARDILHKGPLGPIFEGQSEQLLDLHEETFQSFSTMQLSADSSLKDVISKRLVLLDGVVQNYVSQYELTTGPAYHEALLHLNGLARRLLSERPVRDCAVDDIGKAPETLHFRWPVTTRGTFTQLLRDGDIPALTILAYFAIFFGVKSWYMNGWRESILVYAEQHVKVEPWRKQVSWICELARGQVPSL